MAAVSFWRRELSGERRKEVDKRETEGTRNPPPPPNHNTDVCFLPDQTERISLSDFIFFLTLNKNWRNFIT